MKRNILGSVAAIALGAAAAQAEELTVFGPWLSVDQENVEAVLAAFTEATGHAVAYSGSDSFEQQIMIDAQAGDSRGVHSENATSNPGQADIAKRHAIHSETVEHITVNITKVCSC